MSKSTRVIATGVIALCAALSPVLADQWKAPGKTRTTHRVERGALVTEVDATAPGTAVVQSAAVASIAGDDDGFGFGLGWVPPLTCETFDNRGPEDLGVFDQREPVPGVYESICSFAGSWAQSFTVPTGGVAQFTVRLRILGGSVTTSQCWASPCGCTTPDPQLLINGVPQAGFFTDPGCAHITEWTKTFQGAEAAVAASGNLNFEVHWNNQPFALDWAKVTDVYPIMQMKILDGDGQKGVVTNAVEQKLRVQLSSPDPSYPVKGMGVTFTIVSYPPKASGMTVGADDTATATTYSAIADVNGIATAVLVLGDAAGPYTVQAAMPLVTSGPVTFTETAQKPDAVAILKDSTDMADRADTYAVPSDQPTSFFAVGMDKAFQKIGPMKVSWATKSVGSGATSGNGTVSPSTGSTSTVFTPSKVGQLTISANPPMSGVGTAKAGLFLTALYVDSDGAFDMNAPSDDTATFVPGALSDGTSVDPAVMAATGQVVVLHVLTGPGSKNTVTFSVPDAAVSRWPGIAMNFPVSSTDTSPDLAFDGGAASVAVPFAASGDTSTALYVHDYAAIGTISVTIKAGKKTYELEPRRLPKDADGNRIADAGWRAESTNIPDYPLDPGRDEDDSPVMKLQLPPGSGGLLGDNLTNFEEYRGFVLNGQHRRTNPFHKDYFVAAADFANDIRYAFPALPTATYLATTANAAANLVLNTNWVGLPGSTSPKPDGHTDQKIHRVLRTDIASGTVTGDTVCIPVHLDSPCVPNTVSDTVVNMYVINKSAQTAGITDPEVIAEYRRSVVAHECGHSLNLFHNLSPACMMYGSGSWTYIPTTFCGPVDTTLVDCLPCTSVNPTGDMSLDVKGFFETDTLRIKEDQRP